MTTSPSNFNNSQTQSEQSLEDNLIIQLQTLGYERVVIKDEKELLVNLKTQLEKHNREVLDGEKLTELEFAKILNHLNKGTVFERAEVLRDRMQLTLDDGRGVYLEFINMDKWCQNEYQVTNQITMEGSYKNRYDVTLLVNGLPLVQIELKRRGLELKEAFNQINRYHKHSFGASAGLFNFVQLFVISNGVNTKYYANNKHQSFKQTFFWADKDNKTITQLDKFADSFLGKCMVSKIITKYIVLNTTDKCLMVLRPYQYYAVEAIVEKVKTSTSNGYIWHTTGSGKTLTSFKASQLLMNIPSVHKIVFVVDRRDLDTQTTKEFNAFSTGSVDGTDNTAALVKQLADNCTKLIVTTIQKLNTAITKERHLDKMQDLKTQKIVFIFDECHRSQFGDTHRRICKFFENRQMFGFTGTPIFADNSNSGNVVAKTTRDLFGECLHKYVITDAIRDENVLKFSIEYVGKYKEKPNSINQLDIKVEEIDTKELLDSPIRLEKITDYIIANHSRKTHAKEFTAMFCVSNVEVACRYYELFQAKKLSGLHNLNIATIFSYGVNEDSVDANGFIPDSEIEIDPNAAINTHSRDKLEQYIGNYNQLFGSKFTTKNSQSFYNYYNDLATKVKTRQVDILLVVNMFLTGFDSKSLNTIYVDKNLKYHGLIQAFSRTNRILGETKSQGNIVCFRNLKKQTDEAITLFSNKEAIEEILMESYEEYVVKFDAALANLYAITPTVESVDNLIDELAEFRFIKAFRDIMRIKNILTGFADFKYEDIAMSMQDFEDYKSKYLDIYTKVKNSGGKEKVSILEDVDFELELIKRDDVNVSYILMLLARLKTATPEEKVKLEKNINDIIDGDIKLRSKKDLILKFISNNLPNIDDIDTIPVEFQNYVDKQKISFIDKTCIDEQLNPEKFKAIVEQYIYTQHQPLPDKIIESLEFKPKLLERSGIVSKVIDLVKKYVETFIDGI